MRTQRIRTAAAGVLATATIAAIGCGGDSEDSTSSSGTGGTREEFVASADAICTETAEEIAAETAERFPEGAAATEKQVEQLFVEVTIPALTDQYEEIGALPVPEGDEEEVDALLSAADEAIAEAEEDPGSLLVLQGSETPFTEVNRLSTDYGLQVCGSPEQS
jgi:hypothetical protein